ncbi:phosphopantothenoylcysteine decarboxylase [Pontiellaceae bacterium B12227]|nr:phosphopantothenoylcysteine decarboxylase [Pontiellaceae bacterium B12227]
MHKRILILSGPTHEYIDPVRFIGNASSGLMGKAIAEEAVRQGHEVLFVSGPVASSHLPALGNKGAIHPVVSAEDMLRKAEALFQSADVIIFAAAVADYTPIDKKTAKMPKSPDDLTLKLKATADIAQTLGQQKRNDQICLGFALQTEAGEQHARRKLEHKNLDGIVLNTPATLGAATGTFSFLSAGENQFVHWGCINKSDCAAKIFQTLEKLIRGK